MTDAKQARPKSHHYQSDVAVVVRCSSNDSFNTEYNNRGHDFFGQGMWVPHFFLIHLLCACVCSTIYETNLFRITRSISTLPPQVGRMRDMGDTADVIIVPGTSYHPPGSIGGLYWNFERGNCTNTSSVACAQQRVPSNSPFAFVFPNVVKGSCAQALDRSVMATLSQGDGSGPYAACLSAGSCFSLGLCNDRCALHNHCFEPQYGFPNKQISSASRVVAPVLQGYHSKPEEYMFQDTNMSVSIRCERILPCQHGGIPTGLKCACPELWCGDLCEVKCPVSSFEAVSGIITQTLLSDKHNRLSGSVQGTLDSVFGPYFRTTHVWENSSTSCGKTAYQTVYLEFGDPRSSFNLTYTNGTAEILEGGASGGSVRVNANFSFASHTLIAARVILLMGCILDRCCISKKVADCQAWENQFIDLWGQVSIVAVANFSLSESGITTTIASKSVTLSDWNHGPIPERCIASKSDPFLVKWVTEWIVNSTNILKQNTVAALVQQAHFAQSFFVPMHFETNISASQNVSLALNVTSLEWQDGESVSFTVITPRVDVVDLVTSSRATFFLSERDQAAPPLPISWEPDARRLGGWRISLTCIEVSAWVAQQMLIQHQEYGAPVEVDGTYLYGNMKLGSTPVITVPEDGILLGEIEDESRLQITCSSELGNASFIDIGVSHISLQLTVTVNQVPRSWYVQVAEIDVSASTFTFYAPAFPSSGLYRSVATALIQRFMPGLNRLLQLNPVPLPETVSSVLDRFSLRIVRQSNNSEGYVEFEATASLGKLVKDSLDMQMHAEPRIQASNSTSFQVYTVAAFVPVSNSRPSSDCGLLDVGDVLGFSVVSNACTSSPFVGSSVVSRGSSVVVATNCDAICTASSCEVQVIPDATHCVNQTQAWSSDLSCLADKVRAPTEGFVLVWQDKHCGLLPTSIELMYLGTTKFEAAQCLTGIQYSIFVTPLLRDVSSVWNVSVCVTGNCTVCSEPMILSSGDCMNMKDGLGSVSLYRATNMPCAYGTTSVTSILQWVTLALCAFLVLVVLFRVVISRVSSKNIPILAKRSFWTAIASLVSCFLLYMAWLKAFPLNSLETDLDGVALLTVEAEGMLQLWNAVACTVSAVVMLCVSAQVCWLALKPSEWSDLSPVLEVVSLLGPIGVHVVLFLVPPLIGRPFFSKVVPNPQISFGDPLLTLRRLFYSNLIAVSPLIRISLAYLGVFDGLLTGLLLFDKRFFAKEEQKENHPGPKILAMFHVLVALVMVLPLLIYYQGSDLGMGGLFLFISKFCAPVALTLARLGVHEHGKTAQVLSGLCTIVLFGSTVWIQVLLFEGTSRDVVVFEFLSFLGAVICSIALSLIVQQLNVPPRCYQELDRHAESPNQDLDQDAESPNQELNHHAESPSQSSVSLPPRKSCCSAWRLSYFLAVALLGSMVGLLVAGWASSCNASMYFWLAPLGCALLFVVVYSILSLSWILYLALSVFFGVAGCFLCYQIYGAVILPMFLFSLGGAGLGGVLTLVLSSVKSTLLLSNDITHLGMHFRVHFLIGGIVSLGGLLAWDLYQLVTYESSPSLMIQRMFQTWLSENITLPSNTTAFDGAFEKFFALSCTSVGLNFAALICFIVSVYIALKSPKRLLPSRLLVLLGFILILVGFCMNLTPNYVTFVDFSKLVPEQCGSDFVGRLRGILRSAIDSTLALVVIVKLGFVLTAVPLSLIHAAEELRSTLKRSESSSDIFDHLRYLFACFGILLLLYPAMLGVQLASGALEQTPTLWYVVCEHWFIISFSLQVRILCGMGGCLFVPTPCTLRPCDHSN